MYLPNIISILQLWPPSCVQNISDENNNPTIYIVLIWPRNFMHIRKSKYKFVKLLQQ